MTPGTMLKPTDPLTVEEVTQASDAFFPLFEVVMNRMPNDSKIEDTLRIMESVCGLAHKLRSKDLEEAKDGPFGFNKKVDKEENTDDASV